MRTKDRHPYLTGPARSRLISLIMEGCKHKEINRTLAAEDLLPYPGYVVDYDQAHWIRTRPYVVQTLEEFKQQAAETGNGRRAKRIEVLNADIEDTLRYLFPHLCANLEH